MKSQYILALATLVPLAAYAAEPENLVRRAIESGHASGAIGGPVADEARRSLNATGTLTLTVKRLYSFKQPGCARLQLDFVQEAALANGASMPEPYSWSSQMSICTDGYPPANTTRSGK